MELNDLKCRYHPTRMPVLMCYQCSNTLCPDCVANWPKTGYPRCNICRAEMEPLGISHYVKPFWQCFDRFFKFPFVKENVLFIFLSVIVFAILVPPWNEAGPYSVGHAFYRMLIWSIFPGYIVGYFSLVAMKASSGASNPPQISEVWSAGGFSILFKSLLIIAIFYFSLDLVKFAIGPTAGVIFSILGALLFPASLILLFMEKEVSAAINPGRIIGLVNAIGWPYSFLWALVMMLMSSPDMLNELPTHIQQTDVFRYLALLVNLFFGLILFHLLGYVVYQYHHELGLTLPSDQLEDINQPRSHKKAVMIEAELMIADGNYQSALRLLGDFLKNNSNHPSVQDKYFELALLTQNRDEKMEVTESYLEYLIQSEQNFKAIAILRKLKKNMPDLSIEYFVKPQELQKFLIAENEMELLNSLQKS